MAGSVNDWNGDVIVLGSGAAGLSAAVTAAVLGAKVLVVERDGQFGGTSAISGGALWIPVTRQAVAAGVSDSIDNARVYLKGVLGSAYRPEIIDAFLTHGPEALTFLEDHTELSYTVRALSPDYYPELPGATDSGRALEVGAFDGRRLGPLFEYLRPPPAGMMGFGGMMVNRLDIHHFINMRRSFRSFLHLARLSARFFADRLRYSRGTRLVIGNAMVAALLKAAVERGVELRREAEPFAFDVGRDGRVTGIVARSGTHEWRARARAAVILATGGISRNPDVLADRPDTGSDHLTMAAPLADGSMVSLAARQLGARVGGQLLGHFYWAPMSQLTHPDGSRETFPHIVTDRAKPGIIAITDRGTRFANEADSYHRFVQKMMDTRRAGASRFFLIADRAAIDRYGLGRVRPRPGLRGTLIRSRYLTEASSIADLARQLNVGLATLEETIATFNANARRGVDPQFQRGASSYNRAMGDAAASHPCLAPLERPPFYAVQIVTGDLGSAKGLATDGQARVLHADGSIIPGLYAVGTDMNSPMGGAYPGPGIVLGTGITFGYLAARTALAAVQPFGGTSPS